MTEPQDPPATADFLARHRDAIAAAWPEGIARETTFPLGRIPLSDHLRHWARETPDATSIIFYGREISWAELDALSDRFAGLLAARGIGKGDRVAVFLPNCPQFHIAFFGILKLGAVHCPVSPLSTGHELDYMLTDTGARALVTLDALWPVVEAAPAARGLTVWTSALSEMAPETPTMELPAAVAAPLAPNGGEPLLPAITAAAPDYAPGASWDGLAALNYTGGTTGMPKGCEHTQGDMVFTAAANLSLGGAADAGVSASFFPEFWIAGQNAALLYPVVAGAPLVLMTRWDPLALMQAVERYRVTAFAMVVDGALEILAHPRFAEFDLSSLQRVRVVSFVKKLDRDIRARWKAAVGTVLAEAAWGMTETHTSNTFTLGMQDDDFDLKQQPVFVGLPVPGNAFTIRDFDTFEVLDFGREGEICTRSPAMLKAYWGKPEATAEAIRDGWLRSGDIGVIDAGGHLHYLGRRKEMLKVRGMSVFPAELEAELGKHPQIAGSGVIGRPDPHAGQIPVAFIQPAPGAQVTPEALHEWLAERVAKYKIPEIRLVEALPMTATGKVKKTGLADLLEPAG
ncbi:fatty-acyl-CoA synthase [Albimonas donghaensis]|uniref:Fatty-acyl-CoA synthase n=1 Tax=Albimonas donghaensis TaxID=356660 RepID=A0A1H2RTC6_9RHOB|nr:AMP-binding protein [Albimonas donghaensis]SDW22430.1 fatty-acyl-CoA synthase [Albimonas donghaensis]